MCSKLSLYTKKGFVSYNVHSLVHLYDDYKRFGSLENVNCFSFESYLGVLKNCVRSGYCPLQQISFRAYYENAKLHSEPPRNLGIPFDPHDHGIQIPGFSAAQHFKKVRLHQNCIINIDSVADSMVRSGPILGQVVGIILWKQEPHLIVKRFKKIFNHFINPIPSIDVGIFGITDLATNCETVRCSPSVKKCVVLPYQNYQVAVEIIHDL